MKARIYLMLFVLLSACVVLAGCETHDETRIEEHRGTRSKMYSPILPASTQCAVQFRRDALGAASNNPIPAETDNYNGAQVSLTGTLKGMSPEWIIVNQGETDYWIAKDAILMLKVQATPLSPKDASSDKRAERFNGFETTAVRN